MRSEMSAVASSSVGMRRSLAAFARDAMIVFIRKSNASQANAANGASVFLRSMLRRSKHSHVEQTKISIASDEQMLTNSANRTIFGSRPISQATELGVVFLRLAGIHVQRRQITAPLHAIRQRQLGSSPNQITRR